MIAHDSLCLFPCTGVQELVSTTASTSTTCLTLKLCLTFIISQKTHGHFASGYKVCPRCSTGQIQDITLFACFKTRGCCSVVTPRTSTGWREVCLNVGIFDYVYVCMCVCMYSVVIYMYIICRYVCTCICLITCAPVLQSMWSGWQLSAHVYM